MIVMKARLNPLSMAARGGLAGPELLADALEDEHVGVDRHADGEGDARDAGQGQGGAEGGHAGEQHEEVQGEGDVGDEAGQPVVHEHEEEDDGGRDRDGRAAPADGVGAERRPHRALLEDLNGSGQRPRPQDDGEVGGLLGGEAAADLARCPTGCARG